MKFDFNKKVVLVTGGAEKAGRYFSVQYAKAGADLVITHYKTPSEAMATKEEIEKLGRRCLVVEADNGDVCQVGRECDPGNRKRIRTFRCYST